MQVLEEMMEERSLADTCRLKLPACRWTTKHTRRRGKGWEGSFPLPCPNWVEMLGILWGGGGPQPNPGPLFFANFSFCFGSFCGKSSPPSTPAGQQQGWGWLGVACRCRVRVDPEVPRSLSMKCNPQTSRRSSTRAACKQYLRALPAPVGLTFLFLFPPSSFACCGRRCHRCFLP